MDENFQKPNDSDASMGGGIGGGDGQVDKDAQWEFPWFPRFKLSLVQLLLIPILAIYSLKVIGAGLIDYSLIPLVLLLVICAARQIYYLVSHRGQLFACGLSASEWSGILVLRSAGLFALVTTSLVPSKWMANFFNYYFFEANDKNPSLSLIAVSVLIGVILTSLPITHPAKRLVSRSRTIVQTGWYVLLCAFLLVMCWNAGAVHFLVARSIDSVVFGFPLSMDHGEIRFPENQYNNTDVKLRYHNETWLAVISSALALWGAIVAVRSKRWRWLGVLVWIVSACVAIPYCQWMVRDGWKLQFAVSQFEGYAIEFWENVAVMDLLYALPLLVLLTAGFGASFRTVRDPLLIQKLHRLDPPAAAYWLILAMMCVYFSTSANVVNVQYTVSLFAGVLILGLVCSTKCDPSTWLSKLKRWHRIPFIVLLGVPFYYYFVPFSYRIVYRSPFPSAPSDAAIYILFCTLILLAWSIRVMVRPRTLPEYQEELAEVAIRDLCLARNAWLIPLLSVSLTVFVLVWSLTLCQYLSLWLWKN